MGLFKFSVVLSREITEAEFATLQEAGCAGGEISTTMLPTTDNLVVTEISFDKAEAETLYDAMQAVLDALSRVPNLMPFSFDVPEQENVGEVPEETEDSQIEPEPIYGDSTPVTAEVETAVDNTAEVEAVVESVEASVNGAALADGLAPVNDTAPVNGATQPDGATPSNDAAPVGGSAPANDVAPVDSATPSSGTAPAGESADVEPRLTTSQVV